MSGASRGAADIVFCLDASASMAPTFEALRCHISALLRGLEADPQVEWDWRLEFIAHSAGVEDTEYLFRHESVLLSEALSTLYSTGGGALEGAMDAAGRLWRRWRKEPPTIADLQAPARRAGPQHAFFVPAVETFIRGLQRIETFGDEATLVALDTCLDLPWRPSSDCHRVVVLMTDEPPEAGVAADLQSRLLPRLLQKVEQKRVALHIVAPESPFLDYLAQAVRSEYYVVRTGGPGLAQLDFSLMLSQIGRSVSLGRSMPWTAENPDQAQPPALFGQDQWGNRRSRLTGA